MHGVSINLVLGEDGVLARTREAAFRTEMRQIKEQVEIRKAELGMQGKSVKEIFTKVEQSDLENWEDTLKKEIVYWGQYDIGVSELTKEYAQNNWRDILSGEGAIDDLYIIDETTALGKADTYLYDVKQDIVYKIPKTKIWKYVVHSIEELDDVRGTGESANLIEDESQMVSVEGISYYEPNLDGFNLDTTSIVYYETGEDVSSSITVTAKEYIEGGKQRTIQKDGKTYEFYNYNSQKWANIIVTNSQMTSWWVWIPRYSYKTSDVSDIKFIELGQEPEEGYIVHSDFDGGKKGIWASKYEPVQTASAETSNFPYYLPDMTGFNTESTYIEVYNAEQNKFEETKLSEITNLADFAKKNTWFDYKKQIWANIKVVKDGTESWWVWIPRYAYNITGNETSIIFIDLNNKPLDGSTLPSNYTVHSAFEDGKKGIWASKYEPIEK